MALILYVWFALPHLYERICPSVGRSVTLSWKVEKWNIYSAKSMAKLPHLYDRICPSVGLSVKISDSLSLSLSLFSPRTHPWPLGLVPVIVFISLPSIFSRIMISNRSFITCLLFCHYWESMKRLQRISAISAKYSGSREIRSSEVLLYLSSHFSFQSVILWYLLEFKAFCFCHSCA